MKRIKIGPPELGNHGFDRHWQMRLKHRKGAAAGWSASTPWGLRETTMDFMKALSLCA
jgi:hypothetical protein